MSKDTEFTEKELWLLERMKQFPKKSQIQSINNRRRY